MRGLSRVILVGAGRFDYVELDVEKHVQIFGENGNGKSTLCRALLFFYLGDGRRESYGLDTSKKDWPTYYLGEAPSYVIYDIDRGGVDDGYHIVVTRPQGHVCFRFIDSPYRKEFYIRKDDGHDVIRNLEEVEMLLRQEGIAFDSVASYDEFRARVFGSGKSYYNIFSPMAGKNGKASILGQAIAGIFKASVGGVDKMDLRKFKSVLVSTINEPQDANINLLEIQSYLKDFTKHFEAIESYRKQEKNIGKLLEHHKEWRDFQIEIEETAKRCVARYLCIPQRRAEIEATQRTLRDKIKALDEEVDKIKLELKQKNREFDQKIGSLNEDIKRGEKYKTDYEEKEIEKKKQELSCLEGKRVELKRLDEQIQLNSKEYSSVEDRRSAELEIVRKKENDCQEEFNRKIEDVKKHAGDEKEKVAEENKRIREDAIDIQRKEKDKLDKEIEDCESKRRNLYERNCNIANRKEPEELVKARLEKESLDRELKQLTSEIDKIEKSIRAAQHGFELEKTKIEKEHLAAISKLKEKRSDFDRDKTSLERDLKDKQIDKDSIENDIEKIDSSFASFIKQENVGNWEDISRTLDKDVLQSPKAEVLLNSTTQDVNSVFGYTLNLSNIPDKTSVFDKDKLDSKLRLVNEEINRIKEKHAELEQLIEGHNKAITDKEESKNKSLEDLEKDHSSQDHKNRNALRKLEIEEKEKESQIRHKETLITRAANEFKSAKESELAEIKLKTEEAHESMALLKLKRKEAENSIDEIRKKYDEEKNTAFKKIDQITKEQVDCLQSEYTKRMKGYESEKEEINQRFNKSLKEKGVDINAKTALENQRKDLNSDINRVAGYQEEVIQFSGYWKDYIEPLDKNTEARDSLYEQKKNLEASYSKRMEQLDSEKKEQAVEAKKIEQSLAKIRDDESAYKDLQSEFPSVFKAAQDAFPEKETAFQEGTITGLLKEVRRTHYDMQNKSNEANITYGELRRKFTDEQIDLFGWNSIHEETWHEFTGTTLIEFVEMQSIKKRIQALSTNFTTITSKTAGQNDRFKKALMEVKTTTSKLDKFFQEKKLMDIIDFIKVRIEDNGSRIAKCIEDVACLHGKDYGGANRDLFAQEASEEETQEAIKAIRRLDEEIKSYAKDHVSLEESFDFQVKISENGTESNWLSAVGSPGSTGTAYIAKMSIYLGLIDIIRNKTLNNPEEARLHCLFDEAGTISNKNINNILQYAKENNIVLIASGQSQSSGAFSTWFHTWKNPKEPYFHGQVRLRKVNA